MQKFINTESKRQVMEMALLAKDSNMNDQLELLIDELESLIDANGLSAVLESIADICREKANQASDNWQDTPLARLWVRNAGRIEAVIVKLEPTC
mgnify:CR=1 FL=1